MSSLPLFHWAADPVIFSLGPLHFRWYGLCWLAAFMGGEWIAKRMFKILGRPDIDTSTLMMCLFTGTLIGARLAHCFFYDPAYYFSHPLKILAIWEGGMASHGGAVGLMLGAWFGLRLLRYPIGLMQLLDVASIPAAFGAVMIRFANFINSEIVGKPTGGDYGVIFDHIDPLPRHPVQLYEAFAYALLAIFMWMVFKRRPRTVGSGELGGLFLFGVFTARIVLEHWKTPQAAYEAGQAITVGQWLSVPFALAGVAMIVRARMKRPA